MPIDTPQEMLDKKIRQVRSLLAKADDDATTDAEADLYRAKAEALMFQYRIAESQLATERGGEYAVVPVVRQMPVCNYGNEFDIYYAIIANACIDHVEARGKHHWVRDEEGRLMRTATMVGYDSDLRFAESLYQSARAIFADRMEPKPKPSLSDEDNVYRMRSAGMERIRVARLMGFGDSTSATSKVTNLYKRACAARGEEAVLTGRGIDVKDYRIGYADAFFEEFEGRLRRARQSVDRSGGELVLFSRKENVNRKFYEMYPDMDPANRVPVVVDNSKSNKPARQFRWTKADERRWQKSQNRLSNAGREAGKTAAQSVDLRGTTSHEIGE